MVLPSIAFGQLHSYGSDISLNSIIDNVVGNVWIIFAAIAVVSFLIAGITFLTANGAADKLKTARSAFMWGVVGVVVGILAYSIISVVGNFIGV